MAGFSVTCGYLPFGVPRFTCCVSAEAATLLTAGEVRGLFNNLPAVDATRLDVVSLGGFFDAMVYLIQVAVMKT